MLHELVAITRTAILWNQMVTRDIVLENLVSSRIIGGTALDPIGTIVMHQMSWTSFLQLKRRDSCSRTTFGMIHIGRTNVCYWLS